MNTIDETSTSVETESIDIWDDGMGWDDIGVDYEEDEEYWNDDRYSCGCCRCCGCMCWMDDEDEDYADE